MDNTVLDQLTNQAVVQVFAAFVAAITSILIPALIGIAIQWIRKQVGIQRLEEIQRELYIKQELVTKGIIFAEQAYKEANGNVKFNHALNWIVKQLAFLKINTTTDEIHGFIDSLVAEVKVQWKAATKVDSIPPPEVDPKV